MPATAAIDNETLDHLLSVVNDQRNVGCLGRFWKIEFWLQADRSTARNGWRVAAGWNWAEMQQETA